MGNGYTRQSAASIVTDEVINAAPLNAEFNAIKDAFDSTSGHSHDGTTGESQKIPLTTSVTGILPIANGGTNADTAAGARTNLGIALGSDVQAYDAGLQSISGLTTSADKMIYTTASDVYATTSLSSFARTLIDDADAATARATLGLGSISTQGSGAVNITGGTLTGITNLVATGGTITGITDLAIADGGTGASTIGAARTNLGLGTIATQNSDAVAVTGGSITGITDLAIADGGTGASSVAEARANLEVGIVSGFRNKIINGNFDIWQRGTSFTSTSYSADRWVIGTDNATGLAFTVSRSAYAPGEVDATYSAEINQTAGTGNTYLYQWIEGVDTLAGKTVTVTFTAINIQNNPNIGVRFLQNFGSGGSTSVDTGYTSVPITAGHSQYSVTFNIPSIGGKTLGSGHKLGLILANSTTTNSKPSTVRISHVSVVEGDVTDEDDPFSARHISEELLMCQRYYATSTFTILAYGQGSAPIGGRMFFPNTMRVAPTVAIPSTSSLTNIGSPLADIITTDSCRIYGSVTSTGLAAIDTINVTLDAEL